MLPRCWYLLACTARSSDARGIKAIRDGVQWHVQGSRCPPRRGAATFDKVNKSHPQALALGQTASWRKRGKRPAGALLDGAAPTLWVLLSLPLLRSPHFVLQSLVAVRAAVRQGHPMHRGPSKPYSTPERQQWPPADGCPHIPRNIVGLLECHLHVTHSTSDIATGPVTGSEWQNGI
jgi:hypothetical protein